MSLQKRFLVEFTKRLCCKAILSYIAQALLREI